MLLNSLFFTASSSLTLWYVNVKVQQTLPLRFERQLPNLHRPGVLAHKQLAATGHETVHFVRPLLVADAATKGAEGAPLLDQIAVRVAATDDPGNRLNPHVLRLHLGQIQELLQACRAVQGGQDHGHCQGEYEEGDCEVVEERQAGDDLRHGRWRGVLVVAVEVDQESEEDQETGGDLD